jgi:predicted Zn finger-like uncharacterized protein
MIAVCTACGAKFRVADEKVGPLGAKLRCSKCQTVFSVRRQTPAAGPPPLPRRSPPAAAPAGASSRPEIDLEPAPPRVPGPPDPFAALPQPEDPFAAQFGEASEPRPDMLFGGPGPGGPDPFAAVQAPVPPHLLHPAGPPARAAPPSSQPSPDPPAAVGVGDDLFEAAGPMPGGAASLTDSGLALEERTTPPPRTVRTQAAGHYDDLLGPGAALDGGHPSDLPPLAGGFASETFVGFGTSTFSAPFPEPGVPAPPPPGPEAPFREDPFHAAAVDADPLRIKGGAPGPVAVPPAPAAPDEGPDQTAGRASRLRLAAVNAFSLAVLLLAALALLVVWRGGLPLAEATHPSSLLAALSRRAGDAGPFETRQITSGLYERQRGAPLLFVRGIVVSRAPGPVAAVRVAVDVVKDGRVLAHGEARAGGLLTPEELYQATDPGALARLAEAAAGRAPAQVSPGETLPFLVAIADDLADLTGATLRLTADAEGAR